MHDKQSRLENPERLKELSPEKTLRRIGLKQGHVFCDIGAGTGIFSLPAALITNNIVYALEISDEMLAIIAEKAKEAGLNQIVPVKVQGDDFGVADGTADVLLLATVLHEIPDKTDFLIRAKRMLKSEGKIAVIEFHKRQTVMGPPVERRISEEETEAAMQAAGLGKTDAFHLGENFYCVIFQ